MKCIYFSYISISTFLPSRNTVGESYTSDSEKSHYTEATKTVPSASFSNCYTSSSCILLYIFLQSPSYYFPINDGNITFDSELKGTERGSFECCHPNHPRTFFSWLQYRSVEGVGHELYIDNFISSSDFFGDLRTRTIYHIFWNQFFYTITKLIL